jgi:phosphopentomutase
MPNDYQPSPTQHNSSYISRVFVIVLDGVGVGETPDAQQYGDTGSNSISNTARAVGGLSLPHMQALGLGNLTDILGVLPRQETLGAYGKCAEMSEGKGSDVGHWELMGHVTETPFPTYPNGFPDEILTPFKERTGRGVLANRAASGTEIIKELGEEHLRTGDLIVYTSADSVFQIAANESIVPIEELHRFCEIAREILTGKHTVGRVIARPFEGTSSENFKRTDRRKDYPFMPPDKLIFDKLVDAGHQVYATGKIDDLFGHRSISQSHHSVNNDVSIQAAIDFLSEPFTGLLMSNLIEFDMIYGHRNDPAGYARKLEEFDVYIPAIRTAMKTTDIAMIVADHGVDPTTDSTDHSREYIPLLVFGEQVKHGVNLGIRQTYADVAATIAEIFDIPAPKYGTSYLGEII